MTAAHIATELLFLSAGVLALAVTASTAAQTVRAFRAIRRELNRNR